MPWRLFHACFETPQKSPYANVPTLPNATFDGLQLLGEFVQSPDMTSIFEPLFSQQVASFFLHDDDSVPVIYVLVLTLADPDRYYCSWPRTELTISAASHVTNMLARNICSDDSLISRYEGSVIILCMLWEMKTKA